MFAQIKLLNGFAHPFWYKIPDTHHNQSAIGSIVLVPLKNQLLPGMIVSVHQKAPNNFIIKEINSFQVFPGDSAYFLFIKQLSQYYQIESIQLIKRVAQFITQKENKESYESNTYDEQPSEIKLTQEQKAVVDFLLKALEENKYSATLLHGVTGSGKTEVYKQLIIKTVEHHKSCLLLLPEINLALQFEKLLRAQLPSSIPLFSFHSGSSLKNKKIVWSHLLEKKSILIIGVHVPILLPISNLGSIIVDEEHEIGYQEKKHPKLNTKEAALLRAKVTNIPILLGSATPSLSSLYQVHQKKWHFFQLTKRFAGSFPTVRTIIMPEQKNRNNFWISNELAYAIEDRLSRKEQTIIFLNRRGYSFFVQCKGCSFVFGCSSCSVSLTLHNHNQLECHYCGFNSILPLFCPNCKKTSEQFLKKGIGTQQIVSILEKIYPQARIGRADLDVSSKKKIWQDTLHQFEQATLDILVGTQTITKGYHFPKVTLVGIIWADLNLHFPVYNAAEATLQQLIQVAGRAGRSCKDSLVIVQTMIAHPIFNYLNEINYPKYYDYEMKNRQDTAYPPCIRFFELELKHDNETIIDQESAYLVDHLLYYCEQLKLSIMVLGPARPSVSKIQNVESRKIYLKTADINQAIILWKTIDHQQYQSSIFFTPNPLN